MKALISNAWINKIVIVITILFVIPEVSMGADGGGSQVGFLYGLSVPDAANVNPHKLFGVKGASLLTPSFSLGGYFLNTNSNDIGSGGQTFTYSIAGVEGAYHMPTGAGDTFIGARAGISKVHTTKNSVNLIFSPYHYGGVCGYDYFFTSWMSVGFEGSFLYMEKSDTLSGGTSYNQDSFSVLSFLVSIQLRL